MPNWKPFLNPSDLAATSGTPKLSSILTGSKRYNNPTPADIEGCKRLFWIDCVKGFAATVE